MYMNNSADAVDKLLIPNICTSCISSPYYKICLYVSVAANRENDTCFGNGLEMGSADYIDNAD